MLSPELVVEPIESAGHNTLRLRPHAIFPPVGEVLPKLTSFLRPRNSNYPNLRTAICASTSSFIDSGDPISRGAGDEDPAQRRTGVVAMSRTLQGQYVKSVEPSRDANEVPVWRKVST